MTSVFDLYGYGAPQYGGDSIDASTSDVAALYDQKQRYGNSLFGRIDNWLRQKQSQPNQLADDASLWDQAAEAGNRLAHMPVDMLLAGSRTANNWAGSPQFPERVETGDMLAPLGLGAMAGLGGALKGAARQGRMMPDTIPASYFDDIVPQRQAGRSVLPGVELFADQSRASLPGLFAGGVDEPRGITAYHGSPHDFDRFDMSKIGTGEGAQAYGHGLYFAENEGVAKAYRDNLTMPPTHFLPHDIKDDGALDVMKAVSRFRQESNDYGIDEMRSLIRDQAAVGWLPDNAVDLYNEIVAKGYLKDPGRMYEVRINADPEDFLDWDKPLSQQSEKVREAALGIRNKAALAEYEARGFPEPLIQEYLTNAARADKTGGQVVQGMKGAGQSGDFSQALREAGIPGIRYLDQGSRTAGAGSRNYVLFRDDIIEIVKKYGIAAAASMYGMSNVEDAMADGGK